MRARSKQRVMATLALALVAAALPARAHAGVAPSVPWCGTDVSATDRPDSVADRQVHVIYAIPSDGVDRFPLLAPEIATDLTAVTAWWQRQDSTRVPRFDLAALPCAPSLAALDISDVRLTEPAASFYPDAARMENVKSDLIVAGFQDLNKKYLVYFDSPAPLEPGICGRAYQSPDSGGVNGYAVVWLAPNIEGGPNTGGCGQIENPAYRGGYSAIVAAHELIHTLGGLDTWSTPGPPNACVSSPSHACDNPLDVMTAGAGTFWLDNTFLDFNHDDYYAHSGTWWDVQDSPWLRHLNEPAVTLTVSAASSVASVTSDLPGVDCAGGTSCQSTWDSGPGTTVVLSALPATGYSRLTWGGACASAASESTCTVTLSANHTVTLTASKSIAVVGFKTRESLGRVEAHMTLNRPPLAGETVSIACHATAKLKLVTHSVTAKVVSCAWSVPRSMRHRSVTGRLSIGFEDGTTLVRSFAVKTV